MGWTKTVFKQNANPTTGDDSYNNEHRSCFDVGEKCDTHYKEMVEEPRVYTPADGKRSF